jgi:putative transposase
MICEEERYLLELVRYIHLNPLRAGVVKGMGGLDHYPWSGHRVLAGKGKNDWHNTKTQKHTNKTPNKTQKRDYVLHQFHKNEGKAVRGYRKYMEEGKKQGRRPEFVGGGLIRSLGTWSQVLSLRGSREKMEYDNRMGHEFGISRAEIVRQLGVCTSAIAKAIQNIEGAKNKC